MESQLSELIWLKSSVIFSTDEDTLKTKVVYIITQNLHSNVTFNLCDLITFVPITHFMYKIHFQ